MTNGLRALSLAGALGIGGAACTATAPKASGSAVAPAKARDDCAEPTGAARLLSANPVVPFAWLSSRGIAEAGPRCCTRFADATGYFAVDRWGNTSGPFELDGYEDYDVTHCKELYFAGSQGKPVLYASSALSSAARPLPVSPELLEHIRSSLEPIEARRSSANSTTPLPELAERVMAFEWTASAEPVRYAVVGGDFLAVLRLNDPSAPSCVLEERSADGWWYPYRALGVAQLDATPEPELVIREAEGPFWSDAIVSIEPTGCVLRAHSVGGSTG